MSEPQTEAGRTMLAALRKDFQPRTIGYLAFDTWIPLILAIEREAQGIPPSEALRSALGAAVNALEWCDARYRQTLAGKPVLDVDELRAYTAATLTTARAALAATPSGGIPLIDVELLARAIHEIGGEFDDPFTADHPMAMHSSQAAAIVAVLARLVSESSPAEEGAE